METQSIMKERFVSILIRFAILNKHISYYCRIDAVIPRLWPRLHQVPARHGAAGGRQRGQPQPGPVAGLQRGQ